MITVALSATVNADQKTVWRALVDPSQRPIWDERILGAVAPEPDGASHGRRTRRGARKAQRNQGHRSSEAPRADPLRKTRWRFMLGGVPLVMHDEVVSADGHDRLVSRISIGSMHFDQTLTLHSEQDETGSQTRLGMKLIARNSIAVIGEVVPRLDVQKIVIEYVDSTLRQVQKHCESSPIDEA